jgi:hypothetical protein
MSKDTETAGPTGREAFFAGLGAGSNACAEAESMTGSFAAKLAWYWMRVGMTLARQADPAVADETYVEMFLTGAKTREPSRDGFVLTIDTSLPQFRPAGVDDHEEAEAGDEARRRLLTTLLQRVEAKLADPYTEADSLWLSTPTGAVMCGQWRLG